MKKSIRQAIILAMVMILAVTSTALADTIVSSSFKFNSVMEQPEATPSVEPEAEPTEEAAGEPVVTEEPADEPTEEAAEEPAVTEEPAAEPTEEAAEEPAVTEEPAAEPLPLPTISVSSNLAGRSIVAPGTQMVLTMSVDGAAGRAYTIQWQQSSDNGATWEDIPGANAEQYTLKLSPEHSGMIWRVTIDIEDAVAAE